MKISLPAIRFSKFSMTRGRRFHTRFARPLDPALGQVGGDAAEAHVVAHHARAGGRLEQVEDQLALAQAVQRGREIRAQVVEQEADRDEVADDRGSARP